MRAPVASMGARDIIACHAEAVAYAFTIRYAKAANFAAPPSPSVLMGVFGACVETAAGAHSAKSTADPKHAAKNAAAAPVYVRMAEPARPAVNARAPGHAPTRRSSRNA